MGELYPGQGVSPQRTYQELPQCRKYRDFSGVKIKQRIGHPGPYLDIVAPARILRDKFDGQLEKSRLGFKRSGKHPDERDNHGDGNQGHQKIDRKIPEPGFDTGFNGFVHGNAPISN
jgi:hypothetical protein